MKLNMGSIQSKNGWLHLAISSKTGKTTFSLKTKSIRTAQKRARILVRRGESEEVWLAYLVRVGKRAQKKLERAKLAKTLSWDNIADVFFAKCGQGVSKTSKASYDRWLVLLRKAAEASSSMPGVAGFDAQDATRAARWLATKYISCRRMVDFYRRCWNAIGLDAKIWRFPKTLRKELLEKSRQGGFYRRLSTDEVRSLVAYLRKNSPFFADMVEIGYYTGLRLSDIAQLDMSEVAYDGESLRIVPNKTKKSKKRALSIPLIYSASAIARRLARNCAGNGTNPDTGGTYLFPESARKRPTKRLTAAFRACGIENKGCSRASFHSLRATFITLMDEAGVPPHITDSVTGHGGGGMHARYTQPGREAVRAAMLEALPPLDRVSDIVSGPR